MIGVRGPSCVSAHWPNPITDRLLLRAGRLLIPIDMAIVGFGSPSHLIEAESFLRAQLRSRAVEFWNAPSTRLPACLPAIAQSRSRVLECPLHA
jgi:hypothetical protein